MISAAFLGPDAVEMFPAWDTLPFERVSPEVSTMGQRLRLLWRLGLGDAPEGGTALAPTVAPVPPDVVVAPVRALLQRLARIGGGHPGARGPRCPCRPVTSW